MRMEILSRNELRCDTILQRKAINMLELDINDFHILFYRVPKGLLYGEITHPGLEEPIEIILDNIEKDKYGLLHMQLLNGQKKDRIDCSSLEGDSGLVDFVQRLADELTHRKIFMNASTIRRLMNKDQGALCVLYHELGHMVYFDESRHYSSEERNDIINRGGLSEDEVLADEYAYKKFGNKICETLEEEIKKAKSVNDLSLNLLIREYEIRLNHLKTVHRIS